MTIELDQALMQHFIDANFGLPIAHENSDYDPVAGTAYVQLETFVNPMTALSLNNTDQTDGYLQAILRYPEGELSIDAKTKADEILNVFKLGLRLSYGGQKLTVNRKERIKGAQEDGWYKVVVRIYFTAVLPR